MLFVKIFLYAVTVHLIAAQTTTTSDPYQWGEWTDCQVFRERARNCSVPGSCEGDGLTNDFLSFTYCPVLTDDDISAVTTLREEQKEVALQSIANETLQKVEAIKKQYETSIATSTGFGYIAAISIALIFLVPVMIDVFNVVVKRLSNQKVHSEISNIKKNTRKNKEKSQSNQPKYVESTD